MSDKPAFSFSEPKGDFVVMTRDKCESYWQPIPANGHIDIMVSQRNVRSVHPFSAGTQSVAPGGRVRLHAHNAGEEVLDMLEGKGTALIEGHSYEVTAGTMLDLGHNVEHTFINDGDIELSWVWFFMPGGLEDFFQAVGRHRKHGDAAPAPFPRPDDVAKIEAETVFAKLK